MKKNSKWKVKYSPEFKIVVNKLLKRRVKRVPPLLDDKILTAWNALMITAFTKGFQVTGDEKYLNAARSSALFLKQKLFSSKKLLRRYRDGEARFDAYLEDYAYFIEALLHLYESDFDVSWLSFAKELQEIQDTLFWDSEQGGYFFSPAKDILVRKKEYQDGAIPSANATSLLNLQRLYGFYFEKDYMSKKERLFSLLSDSLGKYPSAFAKTLHALDFELDEAKEIAIVSDSKNLPDFLYRDFLPNKSLSLGMSAPPLLLEKKTRLKGKTTFYVCKERVCKLPTNDIAVAKELVSEYRKIK